MTIILVDINKAMAFAWTREFQGMKDVQIQDGNIFDVKVGALVSPANSFGIMDGGIDGKLRDFFGMEIERRVRQKIATEYYGELPVGAAITTETGHEKYKYLISAPTMRVPEDVSTSLNAYLAMRAILVECKKNHIDSVAIPGLAALSGRMDPKIVARQMRAAYDKIVLGRIIYTHWREEKLLQRYLMCETDILPDDLEDKAFF